MDESGRNLFEVLYPHVPVITEETHEKPVRDLNGKPPEHKFERSQFERTFSAPNMTLLNSAHEVMSGLECKT